MAGTFKESMIQTKADFKNLVIPALQKVLPNCKFISTEGKDNVLFKAFDMFAGVDAWAIDEAREKVRAISSRIQRCEEDWTTFTIRRQRSNGNLTEYFKRIETDGLHPELFLHAYVTPDGEKLKRLAIARTKDIFDFIKKVKPPIRHTGENQDGQASFYACEWGRMKERGYKLFVMRCEKVTDWGFLAPKLFNTIAGDKSGVEGQLNFIFDEN